MSDFIPTVTITVAEYDKLRRDAAPVRTRRRDAVAFLVDAYNEYMKMGERCHYSPGPAKTAQERLGKYLLYVQRCFLRDCTPVEFGDWEEWTKPGAPQVEKGPTP
jgi:hypothetical protein